MTFTDLHSLMRVGEAVRFGIRELQLQLVSAWFRFGKRVNINRWDKLDVPVGSSVSSASGIIRN